MITLSYLRFILLMAGATCFGAVAGLMTIALCYIAATTDRALEQGLGPQPSRTPTLAPPTLTESTSRA